MNLTKRGVLTECDKQFIRDNYKTMTRKDVRAEVRVGWEVLDAFMASEGLSWVKNGGNMLSNNHPWRKRNASLEEYKIDREQRKLEKRA